MKKVIIALAAVMVTAAAFGQGAVVFNNRVGTDVNARVLLPNGDGVGSGWTAQLLGGPVGGALVPLTPSTTFRTSTAAAQGYVNAVDVTVPGVTPGNPAQIQMRAYDGADFASSLGTGSSSIITVTLGGGTLPPANLTGLQGFSVTIIPEPSTIALGLLGAAALLLRRRK